MFGPLGTVGVASVAPRLEGTNAHRSDAVPAAHSHGLPSDALSSAGVSALACPVAVSPTHSSIPFSRVCVNANRLPSGEKPTHANSGFGGTVTFFSEPSAMILSV